MWKKVTDVLPPEGIVVNTKIDDKKDSTIYFEVDGEINDLFNL